MGPATSKPRTRSRISSRSSASVDSAGLDALGDLCDDLARNGVTLRVARMKTPVRDQLKEAGIAERIGRDRFHPTVRAAVSAWATAAAS
jgi:MFS superfamily sulfate permease-like transporter